MAPRISLPSGFSGYTRCCVLVLFVIVPVGVALLAVVLGRAARDDRAGWASRRLLVFTALITVVAATLAIVGIDPAVPDGDAITGVAVSAVFLGALPVMGYYTAGYFIRPWWLLALVLAVMAVASFFYLLFGLLLVADLVYCPPDAYECPL
jgi:hypothetical protein